MGRSRGSSRWRYSRREFLQGTTAAGLALSLPGLWSGCGSDDTAAPEAREARTLHFDLSFAEVMEPRLSALRSPHHRAALMQHTPASRDRHRALTPELADVPDDRLTHYLENVDLPADSYQTLWITGRLMSTGEPALLGMHIHVPMGFSNLHAQRGAPARPRSAKMRAYGIGAGGVPPLDVQPAMNSFLTPFDTAVALVFHHPEIMNLDPAQGTSILNLIQTAPCTSANPDCMPFINTLAFRIATNWPATTTPGGWATLVPMTDANGNPVFGDDGEPLYRYDLADDTVASAASTVRQVIAAIFNDPQYAGINWHATQGQTVVQPAATTLRQVATGSPAFEVAAEHPAGSSAHGIEFVDLTVPDSGARTFTLQVKNHYLRYLTAYVQFANEAGDLPVENEGEFDSDRAKLAAFIFSNETLFGIPLADELLPAQEISVDVPDNASKARIYFGSLGLGGQAFCPEALLGSIGTLAFNIGIPAIFLAAGVAVTADKALSDGIKRALVNPNIRRDILLTVRLLLLTQSPDLAMGVYGSATSQDIGPFLFSLGTTVIQAVLNFAPEIAAEIAVKIGVSQFTQAVFIIGVISRVLSTAADLAALGQTVGEVLTNPALFTNTISLTMTTTVVINKDPNDFQFPARARMCTVTLTYDQASSQAHKQTVPVEPGRVDPLPVVFAAVPSGGMVQVEVVLTTDEDFIIGLGSAGPVAATPPTASTIELTIMEVLIPLTQDTQYLHTLKLEADDGGHVWVEAPAPTATLVNLCQGQDNALCTLNAITVHTRTGMAGYGYQAGAQTVPYCGEGTTGIMHVVQNVFLGENPDRGLKVLPCGFHQPVGIAYDPQGPPSGIGRHFFIQPAPEGFFLKSITLDQTTPFDITGTLVWGRFTQALDSLAVHPAGYVVGVNRQTHKMEILQLPAQAVDESVAPTAVPFAWMKSGEGDRAGLMRVPVAVTVSDNAILVLEQGNARVQAFDVNANPVLRFANGTSSIVRLASEGEVYIDLGVETKGYLYILSYVNDGLTAADYRLELYDPQGNFLSRTLGVAAARLAVDAFRNVYTLNYETIAGATRVEPSLSQWDPSTPNQS